MKWNGQAIVAVLLGSFILITVVLNFVLQLLGKTTPGFEDDELWVDLLKTAVGGLLVYIGANSKSGGDDR